MAFTPTLILPLPSTPDPIYTNLWGELDDNAIQPSDTEAFEMGINERDKETCIVCGATDFEGLDHCSIIPSSEPYTWKFMRSVNYVPSYAKSVVHEARNAILMCKSHHSAFERYMFYIRWIPQTDQFIIVNHSQGRNYEPVHGKLLRFNTDTKQCPFPTAFLWHECRVRGFHPTRGDRNVTINTGSLQDGGEDDGSGDPRHNAHISGHDDTNTMRYFTPVPLVGDNLDAWLEAARQHSSWKDCALENLSWEGTAAENIKKYEHEVGIGEDNK